VQRAAKLRLQDQLGIIMKLLRRGIKAKLAELGNAPLAMTPADFGKLIADETEKWAKVIRAANIKTQ
jgi:hypothetical protein